MMDIEVRDERPRRDERGGGGRRQGRQAQGRGGKRVGHRPPDGKYHDQVAAIEPTREAAIVETSAPTPAIADAPAPRQEHRQPKPHRQHHEKHEKHEKQGSQHRHNEQARRPEAVDKSQLPAFLFRPVPVKKPES
jgi:hypothetical protein